LNNKHKLQELTLKLDYIKNILIHHNLEIDEISLFNNNIQKLFKLTEKTLQKQNPIINENKK